MAAVKHIFCRSVLTPEGWQDNQLIRLNNTGCITHVGPGDATDAELQLNGPVVPTVANLHSHAFQRAFAGQNQVSSAADDSFWTWREQMYRCAATIRPEQLFAIAKYLYIQMLEAGYGCVAEFHYLHHQENGKAYANPIEMSEAVLAAAADTGIAMHLLPVFYAHADFSNPSPLAEQRRFVHSIDSYADTLQRLDLKLASEPEASLGIAAHSLRAVHATELHALETLFDDCCPEGRFHIHISEQAREVEACLQAHGCRPLEWLTQHVHLDSRWCLIHATQFNASEIQIALDSGASIGLCPTTEADLGDGIFPLHDFVGQCGRIGIGSDSQIRVSATEEMRWLEYTQRLQTGQRNVFPTKPGESVGASIFQAVVQGGAHACARKTGQIASGFQADLIMFRHDHALVQMTGRERLLDAWIFASHEDMLDKVLVSGQQVVVNGQHIQHESAKIAAVEAVLALS